MSAAGAGTARLFFALWPEQEVRDALAALAARAQEACGGRAVTADKHHVTLFFLGNVDRSRIAALAAAAAEIGGMPFELDIDRMGYWRHNNIVWAGTARCPPELSALASRLCETLRTLGFEDQDRPYVPHATLLRNARAAPRGIAVEPIRWKVRDFVLVESEAAGGGVHYEVIGRWPLVV